MISIHTRAFNPREDARNQARYYTKGWKQFPGDEDRELFLNGSVNDTYADVLANFLCDFVWSPAIYDGGIRQEKNFIGAEYIGLDFDSGEYSLDQACFDWEGFVHTVGITKSHGVAKGNKPACDRFRVLVKLSEFVQDLLVYKAILSAAVQKFGADKQCTDGCRFFWPCSRIISYASTGKVINVEKFVARMAEQSRERSEKRDSGARPAVNISSGDRPQKRWGTTNVTAAIIYMEQNGAYSEGERNKRIFQYACDQRKNGINIERVIDFCIANTSLHPKEVQDTVRSAYSRQT